MNTLSQVIEERDQAREEVHYLKSVLRDLCGNGLEVDGETARFTRSERIILSILKAREGKVVLRSAIYAALYSTRSESDLVDENTVAVFICRLRRKLKRHSIENSHAIGWRLIPLTSETHNA